MKNTLLNIPFRTVLPADGPGTETVNLRSGHEGLITAGHPELIANLQTGDKLIGTDKRLDRTYFFVERNGMLTVAGYLPDNGAFVPLSAALFSTGGKAINAVPSGDFVVVATADTVHFLLYENESYTWLDEELPFPTLAFGTTEHSTLSEPVAGHKLKSNYSAWSGTLTGEDAALMSGSATKAVALLRKRAESEGYYTQPVVIRTALRLWDDSLLWSPYATMAGNREAAFDCRASVSYETGGSYTVANSQMTLEVWKPSVTLVSPGIGKWRNRVKAVEIYATPQMKSPSNSVSFRCERTQQGETFFFLRILPEQVSPKQSRQLLPIYREMQRIAVISDIDSLMQGEIRSPGLRTAPDASGGSLALSTYAIDPLPDDDRNYATFTPPAAPFVPALMTDVGNRLFAARLKKPLPQPPGAGFQWETSGLRKETATVRTTVELLTESGTSIVTRTEETAHWSESLNGFVAYPDSQAVKITISLTAGGTHRQWQSQLTPAPDGAFAFALADEGENFQLVTATAPYAPQPKNTVAENVTEIYLSGFGNPLQWQPCANAHNRGVTAILPSFIYGSSWQLGRHPAYLFAADGVYLLSFNTRGECTGADRITARIAKSATTAVSTADGAVFADLNGEICRLKGSKVVPTGVVVEGANSLGYSLAFDEIWAKGSTGITVIETDNSFYRRTFHPTAIHNLNGRTWIVAENRLYTTEKESDTAVDITLRTTPTLLPVGKRMTEVIWHVMANNAAVRLTVYGENGRSCHGALISRLNVNGTIGSPLRHRLYSAPYRTVRLEITGTLPPKTPFTHAQINGVRG